MVFRVTRPIQKQIEPAVIYMLFDSAKRSEESWLTESQVFMVYSDKMLVIIHE